MARARRQRDEEARSDSPQGRLVPGGPSAPAHGLRAQPPGRRKKLTKTAPKINLARALLQNLARVALPAHTHIIRAMSSQASAVFACAACGASTSLVCASCLKARFCSPACAAAAWAGHRAACAEFSVLAELPEEALPPVPPAAPLASMTEPDAGAPAFAGSGFACAACGSTNAAVCARCRLVGYCGAEHQKKDWPAHKAVCRKGEFRVVPVLTWEQRMLAEATAAAPASLAAMAALPPIPEWNVVRDGAPPTKIMRAWQKSAESGHARAQCDLGFCYNFGKGVAKENHVVGAEWYAKAAAQGLSSAQFNLGICYEHGIGVLQDLKAAATLYAQAAAQGFKSAQYNLGVLYEKGWGVTQNFEAAADWYAKAAAQGHASAQYNLGGLFHNGKGVAQDDAAAAAWCAKAAAQGG